MKIILVLFVCIFVSSCVTEWKNPNTDVPSSELSISTLLLTPSIYQFERVKTIGKVWNLLYLNEGEYELKFKLADEDGYHIEIFSENELSVGEGDIIEVTGQFQRRFIKDEHRYQTFIIANKVALVENTNIFKKNK